MRVINRNRKSLLLVLVSALVLTALPMATSAQGRGRGRGQEKKLDKFINGHDARDGRWDGRGPRGTRIGRRIRNDNVFWPRRRFRRVNRGNVMFVPRNRHWGVDRDGDGDVDRFDFLLGRRQNRLDRLERRHYRRHARRNYFER